MGTDSPQVTISAATLAGGEKNQDRYAYGDGWAFVLDGASSFATDQPEHDGGWYAERLKNALVEELTSNPDDATTDIVARAIDVAASAHDDPETCPTSTIALARWSAETVEIYVLGDSTAVLIGPEREEEVTDSRLADIAPEIRDEYRSRLRAGHGFDTRHRELLQELQAHQAEARNQPGGYWIAGAEPEAAHHGLSCTRSRDKSRSTVLATDGAVAAPRYRLLRTWTTFATQDPDLDEVLRKTQAVEESDPQAARWPRSKPHDDKTVLVARLPQPQEASRTNRRA